jgi:wobble nucleotide-excising tRNase
LHEEHKSINCEFCDQTLPPSRMENIANHFNEEDKKLKEEVEDILHKLRTIYSLLDTVKPVDKARLYDDFRKDYESFSEDFETHKNNILEAITEIGTMVKDKKAKTTEPVELTKTIDVTDFIKSIEFLDSIITLHNNKVVNLEKEKLEAKKNLETHYLSTIFDIISKIDEENKASDIKIDILNNGNPDDPQDVGIIKLKKRIADSQGQISSAHKACDLLNKQLGIFLGRDELSFIPNKVKVIQESGAEIDVDQGYLIQRLGKPAVGLSEGEKTAIALVYFTVHLQDSKFNLNEGILVVDDPISSLDSNSLFQAFAFLKNSVGSAHQIFLFTHNFDFLKLLLNWIKNTKEKGGKAYYMINNSYNESKQRYAYISKLDSTLQDHETEYHYLFKTLFNFQTDGTIANSYHIPNIARKVLDSFLMFRVPMSGTTYKKLDHLEFDENKKTAIYKFTNNQSHITGSGFDPSLVPETQKNVKYLLEMIKEVFPEHYDILLESFAPTP